MTSELVYCHQNLGIKSKHKYRAKFQGNGSYTQIETEALLALNLERTWGLKPRVSCSNSIDGLNVGIPYSGEFATLQAKKERFKGSRSMTRTVIWRCQPKRIIRGIKIHDSNNKTASKQKDSLD
jgi:hypothetical protein